MYLRSHKWIDVPFTSYERHRELRVRESVHTVMLFDKRYQDVDTGKFDIDKLPTINTCSLAQLIEGGEGYKHGRLDRDYEETNIYDFLRALKKKSLDEKIEEKRLKREAEKEKEAYYNHIQYQIQCREAEERHAKKIQERRNLQISQAKASVAAQEKIQEKYSKVEEERIYLGGPNSGQRIITSKWKR